MPAADPVMATAPVLAGTALESVPPGSVSWCSVLVAGVPERSHISPFNCGAVPARRPAGPEMIWVGRPFPALVDVEEVLGDPPQADRRAIVAMVETTIRLRRYTPLVSG